MNETTVILASIIGLAGAPNPIGDFVIAAAQMLAGVAGWQAMQVRRRQRAASLWCGQFFLGASVWICVRQYGQAAIDGGSDHWLAPLLAGRWMLLFIRLHWAAGFLLLLRINWIDRQQDAEREAGLLRHLDRINAETEAHT